MSDACVACLQRYISWRIVVPQHKVECLECHSPRTSGVGPGGGGLGAFPVDSSMDAEEDDPGYSS